MQLIFAETKMFLEAIKNLDAEGEDVAFVAYLLHMLHAATLPWVSDVH